MKNAFKNTHARGFALVVALSLMILLTVVAVGLLSLASISLRSASQGSAMAMARANARLALNLAIGELQRSTGQDRAITAPASIGDAKNPTGVTGVWEPWVAGSAGAARTRSARDDRFRQWLLSTPDGKPADSRTVIPLLAPGAKDSVTLLGDGALGSRTAEKKDDQRINLGTTPVQSSGVPGRYAWVVIDESTKARADLYESEPRSKAAAVLRAGAPPVDGVVALAGMDKLAPSASEAGRMVSINNAGLLLGGDANKLKVYQPDLTVHSMSLLTDVVSGGWKKDLSLWFSKGLTTSERNTRLYQRSGAVGPNYPADPPMALLESYHQYFKNINRRTGTVSPVSGGVVAKLPSRYVASRSGIAFPNAPTEPLMVPTVLRVDIIFSLVARDVHGGRRAGLIAARRPYLLHLLYLPVVTLHNPYSVPMSLEGLKVTFKNVPIAFQILLDGQALTTGLVPLNQMYTGSQNNVNATKDFSCTLGSAISSTGTAPPLVLQPGQTKLFGTPKVSPTWTWDDEKPGSGPDGVALFDWRNNQTADFQIAPKLIAPPTSGAGFDCDWLIPVPLQTPAGGIAGGPGREGIVSLTGSETISVRYAPFAPPAGNGSFDVKVEMKQSGSLFEAGAFSVRYGDADRLKTIVEQGTSLRFPTARSFPEIFPKPAVDPSIRAASIYENGSTPIKDYIAPKPFVIFSVGSRTTKESFVPTRTIADGNPVMNVANIDLTNRKDPVGGVPLEMVMMPIRNANAAIEEIRATEEGFSFGGSGSLYGSPRATFYEVPRAPLQSLAQFRHANLAGSGFMPMTTYTVGESLAHPQIGTDRVTNAWTNGSVMLDHAWLSNESLWDRYFLSTIADQSTVQFDGVKSYTQVMEGFFNRSSRLPNQRFLPTGQSGAAIPSLIADSADPQDVIAASMLLQGGFNVNSTSEDAWIAVLSGLREADIETHAGVDRGMGKSSAIPRVRRPVGRNIDAQLVKNRVTSWEGYRSLNDATIASLAKEIVQEVRTRGPFLSLADFVNRGIGPETEAANLKGAIQAAIDRVPGINQMAAAEGIELSALHLANHGYKSREAAVGNTATNAPGSITQGDVLSSIGSRITVRADTFCIRAYGETRDASGKNIIARTWCEAIVQRMPEYVDPSELPTTVQKPIAEGEAGSANQRFGRQYRIVGFRWLAPGEV
jgi:hypothetical protein